MKKSSENAILIALFGAFVLSSMWIKNQPNSEQMKLGLIWFFGGTAIAGVAQFLLPNTRARLSLYFKGLFDWLSGKRKDFPS
jgi:FtsH-binding integral membrane protein